MSDVEQTYREQRRAKSEESNNAEWKAEKYAVLRPRIRYETPYSYNVPHFFHFHDVLWLSHVSASI